jgi:hypothetical protein
MNYQEEHRIWELRRGFCDKCRGTSNDPCICGPEPCKKCGCIGNVLQANAEGCDRCSPPESAIKTLLIDDTWMMLCVSCPYCNVQNIIDGNNTMGGFDGDALECHSCKKKSWLGEDSEYQYDDIDKVETLCTGTSLK